MGSAIMTTTIEQKGQSSTSSKPIEQSSATVQTLAPSRPIQQIKTLSTADNGLGVSFSKPVEQIQGVSFNEAGANPNDCFIEQKNTKRSDLGGDSPIEQQIYDTSSKPVEQRILNRSAGTDEPIEQVPAESEAITIEQFDFIDSIFPPCDSVKNPIDTNILWKIRDFGFDFDIETLIFTVQGIQVQDRESFVVEAVPGGINIDYDPPDNFDFDTLVQITITIDDNDSPANTFFYRCSWRTVEDSNPPIITLDSPECNSSNVDIREPIVFTVQDVGEGVNQDTIKLSIEGLPVCSGLSFDSFTTASGNGFTVTWEHANDPFRSDSNVSVSIQAVDLSPLENAAFFVCCFETEDSDVPEFTNWDPDQCKTFIDNRTGLCFEVYGDMDGIDITTLEVRIDNKLRTVFVRPRVLRSE